MASSKLNRSDPINVSVFQRLISQAGARLRHRKAQLKTKDELEAHRLQVAIDELERDINLLADSMGLDRGKVLDAKDLQEIASLARAQVEEQELQHRAQHNEGQFGTYKDKRKLKEVLARNRTELRGVSNMGRKPGHARASSAIQGEPKSFEEQLAEKRAERAAAQERAQAKKRQEASDRYYANREPSHEERLQADFIYFCFHVITITYRPGMDIEHPLGGFGPFKLNAAQQKVAALIIHLLFIEKVPVRVIILKSRQLGCTTLLLALWVWLCLTQPHYHVMFLIDKDKHGSTKRDEVVRWLLEAAKKNDSFPGIAKREEKIITLTNGSKIFFESAESPNPGTSEMIHALHESEKPKWPRGRAQQVEESVTPGLPAAPLTLHVDESTAMGTDEFFHRWDRAVKQEGTKGATRLVPIFLPWFLSPEYAAPVPGYFTFLDNDQELVDEITDENGDEVTLKESEYAALYGLTKEQVYWRRLKIKDTFKGNRSSFDQEYPTTADHAWKATQQSYFPRKLLDRAFRELRPPIMVGKFTDADGYNDHNSPLLHFRLRPSWQDYGGGDFSIWEKPIPQQEYFIGVDVAEGKSTVNTQGDLSSDFTVATVKEIGGRTVARYTSRVRPEEAWLPVILLGIYYNYAWVNGERNGPGLVLLSYFFRTGYPRMLVHIKPEGRPVVDRTWTTVNGSNRDELLMRLRASLYSEPTRVVDTVLYEELKTFIRRMMGGKVRAEAQSGAHDDHIMSAAHAEFCRFWRLGFDEKSLPPSAIHEPAPDELATASGKYILGVNVFLEDVDP